MTDEPLPPLTIGDEISAAITVRGSSMTEQRGLSLASPALDRWQFEQNTRLPEAAEFAVSDAFAPKPQGEYSVTRTLTVRAQV